MSTNIFEHIKSQVSIWDVVNEYATLAKMGNYWKTRCPFHHEKTASFTVSPHRQIFYCFGCHVGGDVIAFIARIENCPQFEAAQFLAKKYGIELPDDVSLKSNTEKEQYYKLCTFTKEWCHKQLFKYPSALRYCKQRNISHDSIDSFQIGFFPGGLASVNSYIRYMNDRNILTEQLIKSNMIGQGKTVLYSPFEERILFPIHDAYGNTCGFGGRTYRTTDTRPKYYNSHEHNHFEKGKLLFGLHNAKKAMQEKGYAFLVEGYTDCVAMAQHGYHNVCATLGTACTLAHLKNISRFVSKLYILFDNDNAGEKAIIRLAQMCWQVDIELFVIMLPESFDPASYLETHQTIDSLMGKSMNIFAFFIEHYAQNFSERPVKEKLNVVRSVLEPIAHIQDPLKRDMLIHRAAIGFDLPFSSLQREISRMLKDPKETDSPIAEKDPYRLEKRIFSAILNNIDLYTKKISDYLRYALPDPYRTIIQKLDPFMQTDGVTFNFSQFFATLTEHEQKAVSHATVSHELPSSDEFAQLMLQLYKKQWKSIVRSVSKKLVQAKNMGNEDQIQEILRNFLELKQKIMPTVLNRQPNDKG